MLELNGLYKTYRAFGEPALNNVTLTLPRGEIVGLFGENGAGKTTLMKSALNLIPHKGTVILDGEPLSHKNITKLSFATCEHSFFPNLSPRDHRAFYQSHFPTFREKRYEGLMDFFQLPQGKALRGFSTGQKNQFEVIMALCQGADYIFMDEPFAGNDVFNRADFYKVLLGILEEGESILLSTHLIEEVQPFLGRAILMHKGEIIADTTTEELDQSGRSLMDFVKSAYGYQADRVSRALDTLTREEEGP